MGLFHKAGNVGNYPAFRTCAQWFTSSPIGSTTITWGTLVLEFSLGVSLLIPWKIRLRVLLPTAIAFHIGIGVLMGISSFSLIMIGGLFILLFPVGMQPNVATVAQNVRKWLQGRYANVRQLGSVTREVS